ncbi:O-antigen ligase family protein [Pseudoroseomonas globiformis]|uniref:O-antigen ligase family protein n=1 Tax=Teichococcus globiformis TaxID=2307229 RepID=A0ABV7FYT2_9PROT
MNQAESRARLEWGAPSVPLMAAALLAPGIAVLQSKAMAPLALFTLAAMLLLGWRARGRFPMPGGAACWAALLLGSWGVTSSLWAIEPGRAVSNGLSVAGLTLLAAAAARLVGSELPDTRRRLGQAVLWGLLIGLVMAVTDHLSGSQIRAAVRGLDRIPPQLTFGLKPAASVIALMLPLLAGIGWPGRGRAAAMLLGLVLLMIVPGDTARIAAVAGLSTAALVALEQRLRPAALPRLPIWLGGGMAATVLLVPLLLGLAMGRLAPLVDRLPPSAVHRLAIWDFGLERAAQHPWLGWGMEASRALPGGDEQPEPERLARLGVRSEAMMSWFQAPHLELMPLHPHNGPLQIRIELGWIGVALAAVMWFLLGKAAAGVASPAAASGALASAFVSFLSSFGAWQSWWLCAAALALCLAAGLRPASR